MDKLKNKQIIIPAQYETVKQKRFQTSHSMQASTLISSI